MRAIKYEWNYFSGRCLYDSFSIFFFQCLGYASWVRTKAWIIFFFSYFYFLFHFSCLPIPFFALPHKWKAVAILKQKILNFFQLFTLRSYTSSFAQIIQDISFFFLLIKWNTSVPTPFPTLYYFFSSLLYMKNANSDVLHYYVTRKRFVIHVFFPLEEISFIIQNI